ncbi:GNAT family N-acetyltransferase [Actinoalloteichus fjordicus]|uniref:Acetyltransferase (GNAT) domain n=1 Tax=Actinoalloteichus fjordicus TaxID=1612552 RepID=A0AAC9LGL9_9PSEU|nr:GNAT family N-acetyltransferase [Actinoalloteichus fjordicus]APU16382.1 Acetyltransferase (GNAT) domain [Actinoalloteichus fjordicus]
MDHGRAAPPETTALPEGFTLRRATSADLDQIQALLAERGEVADAVDLRLIVEDSDAGWDSCAVVVAADGRVVSTATLLDEELILGGVRIPAGQVELVATSRDHEGRGLVRALMAWAHEQSARRGHLAQVMLGIPYFYRQFGYSYAIPYHPVRPVHTAPPPEPGHHVRAATIEDVEAITALQDAVQATADLRMPHSPECLRRLLARDGSTQWIVEREGRAVATGRSTPPEDDVHLGELAAVDEAAARALLRQATDLAAPTSASVRVGDRPGTIASRALTEFLGAAPEAAEMYYVRVADPAALLDRLRPLLSGRLRAVDHARVDGAAVLSFFRSHVRFDVTDAVVGPMVTGGPLQSPASVGGAGIAPDLVPALLFGPHGIVGLSHRHPDVYPGPNVDVMAALFPPVRADLLTFYLV